MDGQPLRIAVTGAAGFIGRTVVDRIRAGALGDVASLRLNDLAAIELEGATMIVGSYADPDVRERLIGEGVDILFHLASLPGGASELDPVLGKRVNLDGSIALLDAAARMSAPRVVYTSSIGAIPPSGPRVTANTPLRPNSIYGTHKAMVELYLADLTRRGLVDGRAVRPSGIVARPREAYAGFATAWMSELFRGMAEGRDVSIPAGEGAHVWLQSVDVLAWNVIHAARLPAERLAPHRAWTLPATVAHLGRLVEALRAQTGSGSQVEYSGEPLDHPPLDAGDSLDLGFKSDGDEAALAARVLARLA